VHSVPLSEIGYFALLSSFGERGLVERSPSSVYALDLALSSLSAFQLIVVGVHSELGTRNLLPFVPSCLCERACIGFCPKSLRFCASAGDGVASELGTRNSDHETRTSLAPHPLPLRPSVPSCLCESACIGFCPKSLRLCASAGDGVASELGTRNSDLETRTSLAPHPLPLRPFVPSCLCESACIGCCPKSLRLCASAPLREMVFPRNWNVYPLLSPLTPRPCASAQALPPALLRARLFGRTSGRKSCVHMLGG